MCLEGRVIEIVRNPWNKKKKKKTKENTKRKRKQKHPDPGRRAGGPQTAQHPIMDTPKIAALPRCARVTGSKTPHASRIDWS